MMQTDIFDFLSDKYKITKPIRLIELFAGIGSQAKALERLGADFEHYKVVEFDKYAIKSYNAVHGTDFETSDIREINAADLCICDTEHFTYLLTYSFPCQDLSIAGKGKGMAKDSRTRSGLLWEVERILNECAELPQILLMENVPQVHGKKNIEHFKEWIDALEKLGYSNFWQDLNAKDYGIPQNRNRCFMVSILGDYKYDFPKPFELKLRLKDMLEDDVDEKYYLSDEYLKKIVKLDVASNTGVKQIGNCMVTGKRDNPNQGRVYDTDGLCPTLNCMQGGNRQPMIFTSQMPSIAIKEATKKGYAEAYAGDSVNLEQPKSKTRRGRVGKQVAQTLMTSCNQGVVEKNLRIRKLTPKECWRLMGFDDDDFNKASVVNSNSQLYKQAGNSIVVNVLEAIFKQIIY